MIKGIDYSGLSVTMLCHDGQGNFLMHQRTDKCRDEHWVWDFGGGGVKFGESTEAAMRRELQEEYLTEPKEFQFLGHRELFRKHNGAITHWITFDYKILVDPETVTIGEPEKMQGLKWCKINELPNPLHSAIPAMLAVRGDL